MPDSNLTPVSTVKVGTKVRMPSRAGTLTATNTITTDDGYAITVTPDLPIFVIDIPRPAIPGSVVVGNLNDGDPDVFAYQVGKGGPPRWVSTTTGTVVQDSDTLIISAVLVTPGPKKVQTR